MDFYVYVNEEKKGPYDESELKSSIEQGLFSLDDLGWCQGQEGWSPLRELIGGQPIKTQLPESSGASATGTNEPNANAASFAADGQDPAVVEKVLNRVSQLLTSGESIELVAVQKKPVVTLSPDAVVLTNKRFMIARPKMMGMTFDDFLWRQVSNVHLSEQMMGATISCTVVNGGSVKVDSLPKAQARKVYAYAQEAEERMHEERRQRAMEEKRAAAGGVVVQSPATTTPNGNATQDPMEVLSKLKKMLDADLIDQAEYDSKKADVLSKM